MRRHLSPIPTLLKIYIFREAEEKYLGFFEPNPGRSNAQRFGNDNDKAGPRPIIWPCCNVRPGCAGKNNIYTFFRSLQVKLITKMMSI